MIQLSRPLKTPPSDFFPNPEASVIWMGRNSTDALRLCLDERIKNETVDVTV